MHQRTACMHPGEAGTHNQAIKVVKELLLLDGKAAIFLLPSGNSLPGLPNKEILEDNCVMDACKTDIFLHKRHF